VVTARRTARLIPRGFGRVVELDWTDQLRVRGVTLSALRPAHWGARAGLDRRRGYNSYLIRSDDGGVLFAGDTAMTDAFNRLKDLRLAIFGIGSYEDWEHAHATPEETWAMFRSIGGGTTQYLLPVHHSTFPIGNEPPGEPMRRLLEAAGREASRVIRAAPGALWAA
jgi:L-ascorbate metabolism protein UlaG (beta-lactamase superfamily)